MKFVVATIVGIVFGGIIGASVEFWLARFDLLPFLNDGTSYEVALGYMIWAAVIGAVLGALLTVASTRSHGWIWFHK